MVQAARSLSLRKVHVTQGHCSFFGWAMTGGCGCGCGCGGEETGDDGASSLLTDPPAPPPLRRVPRKPRSASFTLAESGGKKKDRN